MVLAINKMDLVGFDKAVFDGIVAGFDQLRSRLGDLSVTAIPICARDGDNVTGSSARMPWYTGTTLLAALENAEPASRANGHKFRFPVQYVSRPDQSFRGYAGTVASGTIRVGDKLGNVASRTKAKVARIVTMDGDLETADSGRPVTLVLDREIDVSRGDVLAADPSPTVADQINAWVVWMDETPLFRGRAYQFMLGTKIGHRHDNRHHQSARYRHVERNRRAGTAFERDRPCCDFALASGGVRALRAKPRPRRLHSG